MSSDLKELREKALAAIAEQTGPVQCERLKQGRFPEDAMSETKQPAVERALVRALRRQGRALAFERDLFAERYWNLEDIGVNPFAFNDMQVVLSQTMRKLKRMNQKYLELMDENEKLKAQLGR